MCEHVTDQSRADVLSRNMSKSEIHNFLKSKGFNKIVSNVELLSIGYDGNCKARFKVDSSLANPFYGLHGGFSATIIDIYSTIAVWCYQDCHRLSSTVSMDIKYFKGIPLGSEVIIETKILAAGKSLVFVEVSMCEADTEELAVMGSLVKRLVTKETVPAKSKL